MLSYRDCLLGEARLGRERAVELVRSGIETNHSIRRIGCNCFGESHGAEKVSSRRRLKPAGLFGSNEFSSSLSLRLSVLSAKNKLKR